MPLKNVNRYGETNIRSVRQPLRPDEWKKAGKTSAEPRPITEEVSHRQVSRRPPAVPRSHQEQDLNQSSSIPREYAPPPPQQQKPRRQAEPVQADFFISVPIFNETFDHSYRKKNEFVFKRRDGPGYDMHDTLSRASSQRSLNTSGGYQQQQADRSGSVRQPVKQRPRSLQRYDNRDDGRRSQRQRQVSGSETSYTTSSSYSYESERFEAPRALKASRRRGVIDSDDEDAR